MSIRVQLENVIDEVLNSGSAQYLHEYLDRDKLQTESTPINCSQRFLTKLDTLINRVSCDFASLPMFLNDNFLLSFISILFVLEFSPGRWHYCKFRSRHPLQVWKKPEVLSRLPRSAWSNSARPPQNDKYTSQEAAYHLHIDVNTACYCAHGAVV